MKKNKQLKCGELVQIWDHQTKTELHYLLGPIQEEGAYRRGGQ